MSPPTRLPSSPPKNDLRPSLRLPLQRQHKQPLIPQGQQPRQPWHPLRPSSVVRTQSPAWLLQSELCTPRRRRRTLRQAHTLSSEEEDMHQRGLSREGGEGTGLGQQHHQEALGQ